MAAATRQLPVSFPVFPLPGALLLPRGKLPLNIFEPRYLAMIEDVLGTEREMGMIQPDASLPDGPTGPGLFRVGCFGRITAFSETDDGRYLITLTGVSRFRIAEELEMQRGYRRIRADFSPYVQDLDPTPEPMGFERKAIYAALEKYFVSNRIEANWETLRSLPDDALGLTLSMVCPFAPAEKQALLEAVDGPERDRTLMALLEMASMGNDDGGRKAS